MSYSYYSIYIEMLHVDINNMQTSELIERSYY